MKTRVFVFPPDAIEIAGQPPCILDKVAVASILESILTTSQEVSKAAGAAGRRTTRRPSSATNTHTSNKKLLLHSV